MALMKSTSSLRIRKLSRDELNSYGLRMLNTAYEESLRYKVSQKWGEEGVRKLAEAIAISDACDQDFTDNCPSDLDGLFKVIELIESK
ncbi:hypothetical protein DY251_08895 [Mesorhizobium denitrificans]|uniref:Uncharacterized protein n=1 Tax=Mesorhizobium denitrificans TaxID=2294114 RepID=A0A371XEP5_9HYPH|nr:hypothetical protein DY251_08895 [Mesorhizobium denitrificans]